MQKNFSMYKKWFRLFIVQKFKIQKIRAPPKAGAFMWMFTTSKKKVINPR